MSEERLSEHYFRVGVAVTHLAQWAVINNREVIIDAGLLQTGHRMEGTRLVEPTAANWERLLERVMEEK